MPVHYFSTTSFDNGEFRPKSLCIPIATTTGGIKIAPLRKEGLIDDDFIRMIIEWLHTSGFSVHNKVRMARDDSKGQEALAQYISRNPFSLKKIHYQQETG